jgi:WD40 repeat protein
MRRLSMFFAAVAAPLLLVLAISAASATLPTRKQHHVVRPVAALAMDGPRVAYVTDDNAVRVWNVQTGAIAGLWPGSGHYMDHPFIPEVAVAGTRAAWITLGIQGNSYETWARLYTSSLTGGTRQVAQAFRTDGYSDSGVQLWNGDWLRGLVGSGKVLAVSRFTTKPNSDFSDNVVSNARLSLIPATRGPLRVIASGGQSIVSASSDASRVAVLRPDDSVGIYSATGVLLKQISPSSAKEIAYGGGRLVVLTDTKTLEVYDSRSGKLLHTWPIHTKRSYLQGGKLSAYGRIGLYVVWPISGTMRIHLVDLDNGKELVLPPSSHMSGSQYGVVRQLGVVYSVNTYRSGTPPKMAATLVFLSTTRALSMIKKGR